jgi:hypothetical protein
MDCFGSDIIVQAPPPVVQTGLFPVPANPVPAPAPQLVALLAEQSGNPAPAPATALPASPAAAPQVDPGFKPRNGIVSKTNAFVAPECVCSKTGLIRGVDTGQPGCAKHMKEYNAFQEAYCYVEGDFKCGGAMPSIPHQGLFWVGCEKPDLTLLYPPLCDIVTGAQAKLFNVPVDLGLKVPPANYLANTKNMAPLPQEISPLDQMAAGLSAWGGPMPDIWHAKHDNYFKKQAFQEETLVPAGIAAVAPAPAVALSPAVALVSRSQLRGVLEH